MSGANLVVRFAIPVMLLVLGWAQVVVWAAQTRGSSPSPSAFTPRDASEGVYTAAQAARGKALFQKECAACHSDDPAVTQVPGRGYWAGEQRILRMLAGERALTPFRTAGDLFTKMYRTQPPDNVGGLGPQAYTDILAHLLQANGMPPGASELPASFSVLKNVTLHEKGFKPLFNGTDFTGMGFVVGSNCKPQPHGCARTDPGTAFRIENGEMISTGSPWGYWYPLDKYQNLTLRFDYKWVRPRNADPDEPFFGNSGLLFYITEHQVWPKSLEVQLKEVDMTGAAPLRPHGVGARVVAQDNPEARARVRRPTGEWNSAEVVIRDGKVWTYLNGTHIGTVTEHEFTEPGYIGFQSEGGEFHWRNIRIKPE